MAQPSATGAIRILPNNKVYRQLFDAQVQLSETYNRVRNNQLSQSVNITTRTNGVPLVRNLRPHESQKRQWLTSLSYSNDSTTNPITLLLHDHEKRRENEEKSQLEELKREVFNLPDQIDFVVRDHDENTDEQQIEKKNVTERLAAKREAKFNQLWNELTEKISEINQNVVNELEKLTRQCNEFYERGERELDEDLKNLIYKKDITSLTIKSFDQAFRQLKEYLPPRLEFIQESCQSIEDLEMQRVEKIRNLFQFYSDPMYKTHFLSDEETASRLEKQANELNKQLLDNRRTYAELEARLLTGETLRVHRFQGELSDYQTKWRDACWIIHKQTWISKLSQCRAKLEPTILSVCQPMGTELSEETHTFIEHVFTLKTFIPPISTRENAQKWFDDGTKIAQRIVETLSNIAKKIREIVDEETQILQQLVETLREKVLETSVYDEEQTKIAFDRDITPLFDDRKRFVKESIIDRIENVYERSTKLMFTILERLSSFIQPAAEQWDNHQAQLEHVTVQLLEMMKEFRRPFDVQNEKRLTKLDTTLDEMRSASNETALARLLTSAYEQLDIIRANYSQFYENEHGIVNKFPEMVAQEVERYKNDLLAYFRARLVEKSTGEDRKTSSSSRIEYFTTNFAEKVYELDDYTSQSSDPSARTLTTITETTDEKKTTSTKRSRSNARSRKANVVVEIPAPVPPPIPAFLTEDLTLPTIMSEDEAIQIPFHESIQIPTNLVQSIVFQLRRAFIDYFDQWKQETVARTNAVIHSKHDELDREMDLQMHLHEPRRIRIETDIHHVRTAELVMHEERVERHIRGVQETLEQTDADYARMLNEFGKSLNVYRENVLGLEDVFVNAPSSGRLTVLQDRLTKQRDDFMEQIRTTLRIFRKRFDDVMQYLRQANMKFRKSFKTFSDGGNFSREEIELYRKKLEKTALQIDKAESAIIKEMEKLEKKQLEEATKIMNQFQERFKNHLVDLQFIESTNRWISETQVKIKSEVALNNQQSFTLKNLLTSYQTKLDAILNPNLDKQASSLNEVRELFHQIVLLTYERALYLNCLNNELSIPASLLDKLRQKGLIREEELINDLSHSPGSNEFIGSRRASKVSAGAISASEEAKSVKFGGSSSMALTTLTQLKGNSNGFNSLTHVQSEEPNAVNTIRTLLHKSERVENDEVYDVGVGGFADPSARSIISGGSSNASKSKKGKQIERKPTIIVSNTTLLEETTPSTRSEPSTRIRTRDAIYELYCTFGEKKHLGEDFMSRILNILRASTEGLLTHGELYYKEKNVRPVTRPQALCEKFDEFARSMIGKLKNYEDQCHQHHDRSINEFREVLETFERLSSSIGKIEMNELFVQAEKTLDELKYQFDLTIYNLVKQSNNEKTKNFKTLRPTFGQPSRKTELEQIDQNERIRQNKIISTVQQLRLTTIEDLQASSQSSVTSLATSAELLLILFDEILTVDDVKRPKMPPVRQSLLELVRRQQAGRPLDDPEPGPLIERKAGQWTGLPLFNENPHPHRESSLSKKRASVTSQRQKTSASITTQKTTLPQIETINTRDKVYQKYKELLNQIISDIERECSSVMIDLDRHQTFWNSSIEQLQSLRIS